eukprot:Amastigsp_a677641_14.p4 type:complete len:118 gc:universal Amastigsp_a677641_14:927-1280(+)
MNVGLRLSRRHSVMPWSSSCLAPMRAKRFDVRNTRGSLLERVSVSMRRAMLIRNSMRAPSAQWPNSLSMSLLRTSVSFATGPQAACVAAMAAWSAGVRGGRDATGGAGAEAAAAAAI